MKPNDVMIGNLINIEYVNEIGEWVSEDVPILSISEEGISISNLHKYQKSWDMAAPINLTEEWLLKLGFIKTDYFAEDNNYQKDKTVVMVADNLFRLGISDTKDDFYYTTSIRINYVHQLQNIHYSLNNEHLKIQ